MGLFLIWAIEQDKREVHDHNVPWTIVSMPRHIERSLNKKVRPRVFEEGELVLKKHNQAMLDHKGKFAPTYEGPYMVKKAFSEGALILADMDGDNFNIPTNSDAII